MHRYYVTGHGQFPSDMLRYDNGRVLEEKLVDEGGSKPRHFYLIESKYPPTVGRWKSFLWVVIQTREECNRWNLPVWSAACAVQSRHNRNADRIDGYDRDDLGESPDF